MNEVGKTELMNCGNLSFDKCEKYINLLGKAGLLEISYGDGRHQRYLVTEKGKFYFTNFFEQFATIGNRERSVWSSRNISEPRMIVLPSSVQQKPIDHMKAALDGAPRSSNDSPIRKQS